MHVCDTTHTWPHHAGVMKSFVPGNYIQPEDNNQCKITAGCFMVQWVSDDSCSNWTHHADMHGSHSAAGEWSLRWHVVAFLSRKTNITLPCSALYLNYYNRYHFCLLYNLAIFKELLHVRTGLRGELLGTTGRRTRWMFPRRPTNSNTEMKDTNNKDLSQTDSSVKISNVNRPILYCINNKETVYFNLLLRIVL